MTKKKKRKEKGKIKVDEFGQTMSKAPLKIMFIIGFAPSSASPSSHLGENELFFASFSMKAFIVVSKSYLQKTKLKHFEMVMP